MCCNVSEPEVEYNIDQYSDATLIAKPNIYISLAGMRERCIFGGFDLFQVLSRIFSNWMLELVLSSNLN